MAEMEKYGVEETPDDVKTAEEGKRRCPTCDGALRPVAVTGVLLCLKCGSKPFEGGDATNHAKPKPR